MLTLNEIKEQYQSMGKSKEYLSQFVISIKSVLEENKDGIVIFLGCGSSYSLAKSCAQITMAGLGRVSLAIPAGEVLIHSGRFKDIYDNAVVVAITRSGETSEIIRAVEAIKNNNSNVKVVSMTCKVGTPIGSLSNVALEMPWAFDNSVCQTRTVSCLYFAWLYIIAELANDKDILSGLESVIGDGEKYLAQWEDKLKEIALLPWDHVVVLGDAEIGGICEEGSLAFKEICQLPSNYHHVLDLRHGPMVLIGKDTLVIMPLSSGSIELQKALLEDVKKKGATVIAYTNEEMPLDGVYNIYFGEALSYPVMGLPFILINQLVAYYKSIETGTNPDKPDGLAPWIQL
ncbi:MAG: SIS domain-containing protein [Clostridiales bacterium]|jgi:fructoselysine-6-P-deglycase FrlB-like protein|nr:SIS domain-containing protein [Clostridiales bacterium]